MRKNIGIFILSLVTCHLLLSTPSHAYNFLYIHPTTGEPIGWERGTTIRYYLDPGPLGRLTNDQAHTLLKEAMKIWENASPYADVPHFEFGGYLPEDVDGSNYSKYVSLYECYTDDLSLCHSQSQRDLQTVIIFDEDDSVLENELCKLQPCSANAGPGLISGSNVNPGNIAQGYLVVGSVGGQSSTKIYAVTGLMVHELGHLLGLAHTSVNQEAIIQDIAGDGRYIPTMYVSPISFSNLNTAQSSATLNPDDIAGISVLYPSEIFSQNTGTIKGQIFKSDGTPMMHVNVVARNTEDPLCEAYSFLSGRDCESSSSECAEAVRLGIIPNTGYTISALPPGTYTIEVEEMADAGIARTFEPPLFNANMFGDAEFWNERDRADEPNVFSSTITLTAGEPKENIDIILNRNTVTDDRVKYVPLSTFTLGPGAQCPEEPPVNYAALIGIDESTGGSGGTNGNSSDGSTVPVTGGCSLTPQG